MIKIALAGNPNSGKTTMFNSLTGSTQRVGNWPGVTVEKKEGKLKGRKDVIIQDLPGIYSLSPYTLEEVVSRNYLIHEKPDAVINIIDASNIERNLYLTTQLLELGVPVVLALNMIDIVRKSGSSIDTEKLSQVLGCKIVETSALKGIGTREVAQDAIELAASNDYVAAQHEFNEEVEKILDEIGALIEDKVQGANLRWYAIKVFERDREILKSLGLTAETAARVEEITAQCEERFGDDSESIITSERYIYIGKIVDQCVEMKDASNLSSSDKIDKIVTNRLLALPIFGIVMFLVYYISITTVGTMMTDWVNDGVFGDGFHLYGGGAFEEKVGEYETEQAKVTAFVEAAGEAGINVEPVNEALAFKADEIKDPAEAEAAQAAAGQTIETFISQAAGVTAEAQIENEDGEVEETIPVDAAGFAEALKVEEPDPADFGQWIPGLPVLAEQGLDSLGTAPWLKGLIIKGIIGGVGAVLGFLPQMLVLFLCLAILEDCGYMARIAFIMDRIFRKFGLSGKSFIPMLIGTGCGVPGIMASRTIENENDRRMTVITTTFIPCGAKLPIIALIAGALFANAAWIAVSAYFLGIAAIVISGIMLKKTKAFAGDPAPFVMELPAYHIPGIAGVLRSMWERGKAFIKKAFTIVLLATVLVWFLSTFNWSMDMVDMNNSMLADIGNCVAPLFVPLGWGDWKSAVATFTGLIAKETVVGTFGVLYGFGEDVAEDGVEYWDQLRASFTQLSAYSFLVFNLLCAPCFAAIGAVRREMMSGKWTWFTIGYQTLFAYVMALIIYQLGMLFTGQGWSVWTIVAIIAAVGLIYGLLRKPGRPS